MTAADRVAALVAQARFPANRFEHYYPRWNCITGWLSPRQGARLFDLARATDARGEVVEIGSAFGRSTVALGLGTRVAGRGKVYAIDPHTGGSGLFEQYGRLAETFSSHGRLLQNIVRFELQDNQRYPVYFGVAGIRGGHQSPVRWIAAPVLIQASDGRPATATVQTPDDVAGTARQLVSSIVVGYASTFKTELQAAVLAQLGALPTNGNTVIEQALYRLVLKIKDVTRKGGTVTLDDWGVFGVRWSAPRTARHPVTGVETVLPAQRQPTFTASIGFKAGTRAGLILTDAEARNP